MSDTVSPVEPISGDDALSSRLARLSPEKRALLERAMLAKRAHRGGDSRIPRRNPNDPAPLSFPQQRLWFFDRLEPGNTTYNACVAMELNGPLNVEALCTAFKYVVQRHEVIRTVYPDREGKPYQSVLEEWSLDFEFVDISQLPSDDRVAAFADLVADRPRKPYDLSKDLTMRILVVRRAENDHALLILEHHIAFDGWSDEILCDEVNHVYRSLIVDDPVVLKALPLQYRDFAAWQHARLDERRLAELQEFWKQYLRDAPALLALPLDMVRPERQTFHGGRVYIDIDASVVASLASFGRSESATPFMVLLAAFDALLHRWAAVDDICVGTPIANRNRVELEKLIGFFSNTLVVRARIGPNMTLRDLVRHIRAQSLAAFEHQELPFDKIVEAAQPPRDPSHNPIFQVNFRVTAGGDAVLDLPDVTAKQLSIEVGFARFDLAMELQQLPETLGGYLEYNTALFNASTAEALVAAFSALLGDALERPDEAIANLRMAPAQAHGIRARRRE